jgi:hypothetical protein
MERYGNYSGRSSVVGYDEWAYSIIVYFSDGTAYEYTEDSVGSSNLNRMKELAESGEGLNSFIMNYVRFSYSKRIR